QREGGRGGRKDQSPLGHRRKMAMESPITQEEIKKELEKQIDLEKTCPLMRHFFTTHNGCHRLMDEFSRGNMPSSKLQIYIWMDATLKDVYQKLERRRERERRLGDRVKWKLLPWPGL
uniref:18 kDa Sin3-associated polypeptide n=1 Tax=Rhinolophus ferrumequinum TaxID=59479 RepID=A0A671ETN4_RHIFE